MSAAASGARVVLVVTGGIASYKACEVVRRLRDADCEVRVAMTASATRFVTPATFAALSGNPVQVSLFDGAEDVPHVRWAEWADLLCVLPATANFLAKLAHGVADDFASTLCLANAAPVLVAPAMEDDMYRHAAVQRNLATLAADGVTIIGPESGALASGRSGPGRMSEPVDLVAAVQRLLRHGPMRRDLAGVRVVVTAGPTWEALDPIRGLTSRSSGRMGYALAREALWRGASVDLVAGPVAGAPPPAAVLHRVESAAQMKDAVDALVPEAEIAVLCAAVADFRPVNPSPEKLKKSGSVPEIELEPTADILAAIGKLESRPFLVGFAAETENLLENARGKLRSKNCDVLIANQAVGDGVGMGAAENEVVILDASGGEEVVERASKAEIATRIWNVVVARHGGTQE
jgi:phosphopantothenoylcysteine decarboxylase/phosphopantothenate--cysteine ligase